MSSGFPAIGNHVNATWMIHEYRGRYGTSKRRDVGFNVFQSKPLVFKTKISRYLWLITSQEPKSWKSIAYVDPDFRPSSRYILSLTDQHMRWSKLEEAGYIWSSREELRQLSHIVEIYPPWIYTLTGSFAVDGNDGGHAMFKNKLHRWGGNVMSPCLWLGTRRLTHGFSVGLPSPTFETKGTSMACPSLFGWTASICMNDISKVTKLGSGQTHRNFHICNQCLRI